MNKGKAFFRMPTVRIPNVPAQENFTALNNGRLTLVSRARRGERGNNFTLR
jgi:hypothetical protein